MRHRGSPPGGRSAQCGPIARDAQRRGGRRDEVQRKPGALSPDFKVDGPLASARQPRQRIIDSMQRRLGANRFGGLALLVFLCGCSTVEPEALSDPAVTEDTPPPPTVDPVPAELPDIVARVHTRSITREELERAVRSAEIQAGQALPTQFRDQVYRSVLDRLVSFRLLVMESETRSISVDDTTVEARIETIRSSFPSEDAFETQLDSWNTTLETLRDETRRDLLVEHVLESEVLSGLEVDAEVVREFYEQHADQFTEGGGVRARHILVGMSPDATDSDKAEARERADTLRRDVEAGADFAEVARTIPRTRGRRPTAATLAPSSAVRPCRNSRRRCSRWSQAISATWWRRRSGFTSSKWLNGRKSASSRSPKRVLRSASFFSSRNSRHEPQRSSRSSGRGTRSKS